MKPSTPTPYIKNNSLIDKTKIMKYKIGQIEAEKSVLNPPTSHPRDRCAPLKEKPTL